MSEPQPKRRRLPALGVTTVGLAVSAGSIGLYNGASAEPAPPAPTTATAPANPDAPTWGAVPIPKLPAAPAVPQVAPPTVDPAVQTAGLQLPALPEVPPAALPPVSLPPATQPTPALPPVLELPALPQLPSVEPAEPTPPAPLPKLPEVMAPPTLPALPTPPAVMLPTPAVVPAATIGVPPEGKWPPFGDGAKSDEVPSPRPGKTPAVPATLPTPPVDVAPPTMRAMPPATPGAATFPILPTVPTPSLQPEQSATLPQLPPVKSVEIPLPPAQPGLTLKPSPDAAAAPGLPVSVPPAGSLGTATAPEPAPGDVPMLPKMTAAKSALLGVALAATPAFADEPKAMPSSPTPGAKQATAEEKLAEATKKLDEANKQLEAANKKIAEQNKAIEDLRDEVFGVLNKETGKSVDSLRQRLTAVESKFATLQEKYSKLEGKVGDAQRSTSSYQANATTPPPAGPAITGPKGSVKIVNDYAVEITMIVNGSASHRLAPNAVKLVEVPAGTYTYELVTSGSAPATGVVRDGDTITLRVH